MDVVGKDADSDRNLYLFRSEERHLVFPVQTSRRDTSVRQPVKRDVIEDIVDNITLYWLTNTAVSSARLYWENKLPFFAPKGVKIPVAVSAFPEEICPTPRKWAEKAYPKLAYYKSHATGAHFAAFEQPDLFVAELCKSLVQFR